MGFWKAVSGAVSSVGRESKALADPRKVLRTIDPRVAKKAITTGRLPGASMVPGGASFMPGAGLSLKDRVGVARGNPEAVAKAILATAQASPSSKWAPKGFAKGLGPLVSNIASAKRGSILGAQVKAIRLPSWW